jgi:hypothetical protein
MIGVTADTIGKRRSVPVYERATFIAIACAVLVAAPFISALTHVFDYHDSFGFYAYQNHLDCRQHPQFNSFFLFGRPLYAYLNCFLGTFITNVQDAIIVRAIGLSVEIASVIWIARILRGSGMPAMVAIVAACALIWLPGFQFFTAMTQATCIVFSLPLVVLAFVELRAGCAALQRRDADGASNHLLFSVLALLIAANIYQQITSLIFCLVFATVWQYGPKLRKAGRLLIAGSIGVFGVQGIVYLLTYRFITAHLFFRYTGQSVAEASAGDHARDIALSTDIGAKLHLFYALTPNSFGLWLAGPPVAFYMAVIVLSAAAVCTCFILDLRADREHSKRMSWAFAFEKLTWLAALVLLANAPNLVAKSSTLALRDVLPYQWLIVLLFLSTGWRVAEAVGGVAAHRIAAVVLGFFTAIGVCASSWNLYRNFVMPSAGEFRFIQKSLGDYVPTATAPVCVIQPGVLNVGALAHPETQVDEFGKLTTMFPQDVPWIVSAAVKSRTGQINGNSRVLKPAESPAKFNCGVVIDMRRYVSQLAKD